MSTNATIQENNRLPIKKVIKTVSMLLCNSCYWCATALYDNEIEKCPRCDQLVEPIPLQDGEMVTFDYSAKKGVTLEFRKAEK
jgi:hypothetical protein